MGRETCYPHHSAPTPLLLGYLLLPNTILLHYHLAARHFLCTKYLGDDGARAKRGEGGVGAARCTTPIMLT